MKTYTLKWDDEKMVLQRTNDGFSPLELIGILELSLLSIKDQMVGKDTTPITTIKQRIEK